MVLLLCVLLLTYLLGRELPTVELLGSELLLAVELLCSVDRSELRKLSRDSRELVVSDVVSVVVEDGTTGDDDDDCEDNDVASVTSPRLVSVLLSSSS